MLTRRRLSGQSAFNRNVLTMISGTAVAQAIPIVVSPVLTRLFTPEDFGTLAIYLALASILLYLGTGRYELSIILPPREADARSLVLVIVVMASVVAGVTVAGTLFWGDEIGSLLNNAGIIPWLRLLPVSILVSATYLALYYYHNRHGRFANLAQAQITQSGTTAGTNVISGSAGAFPGALIIGTLAGQMCSMLLLAFRTRAEFSPKPSLTRAWRNAGRYRKFPAVQLPATLLETVSSQAPAVLLSSFFGPVVVGLFALSQRVVRTPIGVIGNAVSDVFRQRAGRQFVETGNARSIFVSTFAKLLLISVLPFGILVLAAPTLFAFVFGEEWRRAGEFAQILSPMFWMSFVVRPVSSMLMIAEKQEYDLALQLGLLFGTVTALFIGEAVFGSVEATLTLLTVVYFVKYSIELALSYVFTVKEQKEQSG